MAQVIEDTLAPILEQQEKAQLKRMYDGLFALQGLCKDPIPDASTTIDEVLYGDDPWKGEV